ncbi:hypothetical protein G3N55_06200 [Dissulfurirhabdus thermomarina]|uniref:Uncharacterized protein n=1 Tax=Dissulfurirhabdus thermomarina TaxID=1765737 RepID=A0A6N9TQP6_DISTH|nr:hypothetical protein [Dissulfurirhabdus thermomarina]NDY42433.1 hypothetical protein [Dissulfurirhabdus thermomarina]NMX24086.1 hypothetical protein [Dissulfurirhabdus thermomarina]
MKRLPVVLLLCAALLAGPAAPALAADDCPGGKSGTSAMWLSILHPGLGEWYLKGWGGFKNCPTKKFWLGFIPLYGWPGYLQVKSAIDARHCRTNDDIGG